MNCNAPNCSTPIRIMIVDDHAIVRSGLTAFIKAPRDFELAGEADNGQRAVVLCELLNPDVVLMDLKMPQMDGLTATRLIKAHHPTLPVLILTSSIDQELVSQVVAAGAAGYILKEGNIKEMASAILSVHRGDPYFSPQVTQLLMNAVLHRNERTLGDDLTARERGILKLIIKGYTNRQIAETLSIAPATAKFHVGNILSKLEVSSRAKAVAKTLELGLLDEGETIL